MHGTYRRIFSWVILIVVTVLSCSCAHNSGSIEPSGRVITEWNGLIDELQVLAPLNLHDYSQLVVAKLDTNATPLPPADDNTYEPVNIVLKSSSDIFTNALKGETRAPLQVVGPVDSLREAGAGTLLIKGKVSKMDPGSQALRYWIGFGAGKTVVEVTGEVVDASSNKTLLRFKHARASGVGAFGGEYTKFLTDDMHDLGKDVGSMLQYFNQTAAAR